MCKKNLSKISFFPEKKLLRAQGCVVVLVEYVLCWKWVRGHFNEASILKNTFVRESIQDSYAEIYRLKMKTLYHWIKMAVADISISFFPSYDYVGDLTSEQSGSCKP